MHEMRFTTRLLEKRRKTYEVGMTATLQKDSQGRDKDGKSSNGMKVNNKNKQKGARDNEQDLRRNCKRGSKHIECNIYLADVRTGERHWRNKWVGKALELGGRRLP